MRTWAFSTRNFKEIARDPLTFVFGILLPVLLIAMVHALTNAVGAVNPAFAIVNFAPGMAVFSLTFVMLFSSMLVSGDRASAFLARLFASPMRATDYILGYSLPAFAIGLIQAAVCFVVAAAFGLRLNNLLPAMLALIPSVLLMTGMGLLLGTALTDKQSGGIFPILINAATLLSGTWFDLKLIGGGFEAVGYALPFAHAVDAARLALEGNFAAALPHLGWVLLYAAGLYALAVWLFRRKMRQ
jgi:ABC-2 type transport system permease protein